VKIFKDSGKDAVGINKFFYPADRLFIEEHNLEVYEMDMHSMEFDDESFDAVWCRHTLEHSFAPLQVLAEIYRVTKNDSYLFAVLPPPPEPQEPYEGHWHQIPFINSNICLKCVISRFSISKRRIFHTRGRMTIWKYVLFVKNPRRSPSGPPQRF
jgi:ubiquinone/menaquinone biosynthesis C-methylase UbiE